MWTGTVTDTMTGRAIANATATLGGSRVSVAAPGYLTRETRASAAAVDLIPEAGFDLDFYRQFARQQLRGADSVTSRAHDGADATHSRTGLDHD
jgi:hypothetical protein